MNMISVPGFTTESIHIRRRLLAAGTSRIPVGEIHENLIQNNVSGACYIVTGRGVSDDECGHKFPFYPGCLIQWPPGYRHYRRIFSGT